MLWSYKKPTEPGWYDANRGDVVTACSYEQISLNRINVVGKGSILVDQDDVDINNYNDNWKFRPIDYEYLNKIGNEE